MRKAIFLVTTLGLAGSLAAGCGSDSDNDSGGSSGGIALEDLGQPVAEAQCELFSRCFGAAYDLFLAGEDCQTRTEAAFEDQLSILQAAVDSGNATYDGTKAQACIDSIANQSCSAGVAQTPECEAVVIGSVEEGGDCTTSEECSGDAYCAHDFTCPGTCTAEGAAGASCEFDEQCADELICSEAGSCVKPAGLGEDCQGDSAPDCGFGLFCLGEDEEGNPGTCRDVDEAFSAQEGASCGFDTTLCASGLSCVVDSVDMTGAVFVCAAKVASGATCKVGIPEQCPTGEYCDADVNMGQFEGTCMALAGNGEACTVSAFSEGACGPNLRCDGGTCRPLQQLGESCTDDEVCYSELCEGGVCVAEDSCQ